MTRQIAAYREVMTILHMVNRIMTIQRGRAQRELGSRRGFTLIEILIVLALTSILLILVFKPLIDGFNLTSRSGTQVQSQAAAREVTRQITTLLSNAVFVFDNSRQESLLNLWFTDSAGNPIVVPSQFTMIEYVAPSRQQDQNPTNLEIDPTTGEPIYNPGLPANKSGFALPLTPGRVLGRIFIGLRDNTSVAVPAGSPPDVGAQDGMPLKPYGNKYEDPSIITPDKDNRYELYRAEVPVYRIDPDTPGAYIPNLSLFHTVDANGNITDKKTDTLKLHDPNFYYDHNLAGDATSKGALKWAVPGWKDLNGDGKVEIWENWHAVATAMLRTDKADMMAMDRDETNRIVYDPATKRPTARPLALFSPSYVNNDAGTPASLGDAGNESPSAATTNYSTEYAHWAGDPNLIPYHVFVYRSGNPNTDPLTLNPLDFYETIGDGRIVHPANIGPGNTPPDPKTQTDVGPQIRPDGTWANTAPMFAFTVDSERGIINFAFPWWVLDHDSNDQPAPSRYSPPDINDALDPNNTDGINGTYQKRYLDLHLLPATAVAPPWNGTVLNAAPALSPLAQLDTPALGGNVRVEPGSERVYGPDQNPGPHYGYRIQYTRVASSIGVLGHNEYRINYDNVPNAGAAQPGDPRVAVGYIEFDSQLDTTVANIPDDPANGVYKPHGLPNYKYDPATNQNVLSDAVEVSYSFQMNKTNDVVKSDYLTRELMNLALQIRLYDPASSRPQITALTTKVKVRNLQH